MSAADVNSSGATAPEPTWKARFKQVGPGIMAAATGVGAGDLVATLVAGSRFGYALFWAVVLGTLFKLALGEAVGRWHLASGRTMLAGWRTMGRWAVGYFGIYTVVWGFVYGATAMSASALPLNAMFPVLPVSAWGIICGLLGLALVWFGRYALLEKIMTVLVGVMFVTVVGTAIMVGPNLLELGAGLVPTLPDGSVAYVLGLMGGVGGTITMAAYGYWTFAKGWRAPSWMPFMRADNAVGYITTGIFVVAMLVVGAEILLGHDLTSGDKGLLQLSDTLAADYGQWARIPFLVGFFAVAFSSVIGVWNGVSLLFADWWRTWRLPKEAPPETAADYDHKAGMNSTAYRVYLLWLTFPPMLLLFLGKPFQLTVVYGVLGALFMPFLAGTLLVLLNSKTMMPAEHRSRWLSNTMLVLCLALFVGVAFNELVGIFTE
ncbi:Mn2+ and Fe2+ transporters of the NRAMP family [Saccharopolyspora kobensis]|uniref:Mn2+ and Fe2+ transporters of the NRAMP family n=1 Tax=Saccharopolyspora kobensis TaxID=146035 RepID=A0A1H6D4Z0_9PSEU|nr:Nramp family divalent metal transporter [Saccharopolyspora kobensis]SEG79845.1 Mn2+ and Fe2+ transporters of the NRAMP family [Saccharopolyspora kobensis]SFD09628.1 Mn2+ and Fe2+ transporters of the NRAMP family [Saccharopolyspora kobensis]